jgi:S1-C subfamily serine protease
MGNSKVAWTTILIGFCLLSAAPFPSYADTTSMYNTIEPSLALVIAHDGKFISAGTAFCIGSHDNVAYLLTNRHVVGSDTFPRVILRSDSTSLLHGQVIRRATIDAVVLAVYDSKCTPLTLSAVEPSVGTSIGIAGFPDFQLKVAEDLSGLSPSFHEGSVSALVADGGLIEYDAQTDRGNSGSPLFDMQTGAVYGLVTAVNTGTTGALQNNLAISIASLKSFLDNSHANVAFGSGNGTQSQVPAPGSMAATIDLKCGRGTFASMSQPLYKSNANLNANDYISATKNAQASIETASACLVNFSTCQAGIACDDRANAILMGDVLMAQQVMRISAARTNGDAINTMRNEASTALALCNSPNILIDSWPYTYLRSSVVQTMTVIKSIQNNPMVHNDPAFGAVRGCAAKVGIQF